jgi:hypothetical protein
MFRKTKGPGAASKLKRIPALVALVTTLSVGVGASLPANADDKSGSSKTPVFIGNVDPRSPHVSSDATTTTKDLGPCSYLLAGVAPFGFSWSGEFRWFACSYWGANAKATKNYQWYVSPNSNSLACAQGYGFKADHTPVWVYLSCGDSGATEVSWGNVAAYPKMKFQSLSGLVVPLYWY